MLAAIDIHKAVFQTAVLNRSDGEIAEDRFQASRDALRAWIEKWNGTLEVVAIEATTGWRWVARELQEHGIEVRLTDPGQASALQGKRKRPKNDRLDARWLVMLLARELLPGAWLAPEDIQRLRDKTRLRKALTDDHALGATAALVTRARGLAVLTRIAADRQRPPLGSRPAPAPRRTRPDQRDAHRHGRPGTRARHDRLRAAPPRQT